ncbi:MAG: fasciclin domain-containing protein [Steroidobacteraceae bacterium]
MTFRKFAAALALTVLGASTLAVAQDRKVGDIIHSDARYTTFARAIDAAGLDNLLANDEAVTVLAPTDDAFAKLPAGTLDNLLKPENKDELAALLKRHFVVGSLDQYDLKRQRELATAGGEKLPVKLVAGSIRIADARVFGRQAVAVNGTVQPLDTVLTH